MATEYTLHLPATLPHDWRTAVLESIASFTNGLWKGKNQPYLTARVLRNTNFNNDGTLDYSNIAELLVQENQFSPRQLRSGDIILERSGGGPSQPVGRVVFFDRKDSDFSFSNFTTRVRVTDESVANSKYLLYFLLHFYSTGHTNALQSRTTGIRNLMFSDYKQVVVPLPPLAEQRRIAAVLTALQDAIAAQEDVIAAARAFKRSLMHRLFTYGPGPVPAETKETEIGEIPSHWEVVELGELVDVKGGKRLPKGAEYADDVTAHPYIRVVDFANSSVSRSDLRYISQEIHEQVSRYIITDDDVYISIAGTIGVVGTIPEDLSGANLTENAAKLVVLDRQLTEKNFLAQWLGSASGQAQIQIRATKTSQPKLALMRIKQIPYPQAPFNEQLVVSDMIASANAKIAAEEDRKDALDALFKSMLHQLMTGQIRLLSDDGLPVL